MGSGLRRLRLLGMTVAACTQLFACGKPALDDAGLARLTTDFQAVLDSLWDQEGFPGATAGFVLPDGRYAGVAAGYADVERQVVMPPDAKMLAGSIGKTFVAAVALSLSREGKIDLDDRLERWLGHEEWYDDLPNGRDITIRMLLNHSSGVPNHVGDERFLAEWLAGIRADPAYAPTPREVVAYILDDEPLFAPGDGFGYTDTGYILAALALEEASGLTLYELARRRFLEPLGLDATIPSDQRELPGLVQGYTNAEGGFEGLPIHALDGALMTYNPAMEWAGGGFASNPQDLVRWAKALYEGQALDAPYLDDLLEAIPRTMANGSEARYGLAVGITETPFGLAYGHGGSIPGYRSRMAYYPEHKVAVAIQVNTGATAVSQSLGQYMLALARVVIERGM